MEKIRAYAGRLVPPPRAASYDRLTELASRYAELELEIGCGAGWHPIAYARSCPERALVAIERTHLRSGSFRGRLARHAPIDNLLAIHADAVPWLTHAPPEARFSRIWLLYPNPEPQNPARRWLRMPFFQILLDRLAPDGEIEIRTNEEAYATEAAAFARSSWGLRVAVHETWSRESHPDFRPITHFERKYFAAGLTLHRLIVRKP